MLKETFDGFGSISGSIGQPMVSAMKSFSRNLDQVRYPTRLCSARHCVRSERRVARSLSLPRLIVESAVDRAVQVRLECSNLELLLDIKLT